MKKGALALLVIMTLIFNSCFEQEGIITPEIINYSLNQVDSIIVVLNYNQKVLIDNKLEIYFDDVVSDSRCPINVKCIWAGDGEVKLKFKKDNDVTHEYLHTYLEPKSVIVYNYFIKLNSLMPYPEFGKEIIKTDYKVELIIKAMQYH